MDVKVYSDIIFVFSEHGWGRVAKLRWSILYSPPVYCIQLQLAR